MTEGRLYSGALVKEGWGMKEKSWLESREQAGSGEESSATKRSRSRGFEAKRRLEEKEKNACR